MTVDMPFSTRVPCDPGSLPLLDELCEKFIAAHADILGERELNLRLAVVEAGRNALVQPAADGVENVVVLTFQLNGDAVSIDIVDPGNGLQIEGCLPPYPEAFLRHEFVLARSVDQAVLAKVKTPRRVTLKLLQDMTLPPLVARNDVIQDLGDRGYGLFALCKAWNEVVFELVPGQGNVVHLEEPRVLGATS